MLFLALQFASPLARDNAAIGPRRVAKLHKLAHKVAGDVLAWTGERDIRATLIDAGRGPECLAARQILLEGMAAAGLSGLPPVAELQAGARRLVRLVFGSRSAQARAIAEAWSANVAAGHQIAGILGVDPAEVLRQHSSDAYPRTLFETPLGTTSRKALLGIQAVEAFGLMALVADAWPATPASQRKALAAVLLDELEDTGALLGAMCGYDRELSYVPEHKRRTMVALGDEQAADASWRVAAHGEASA